jgi:hypothetical protein
MYHPILAGNGKTGDLFGVRLRPGNVASQKDFLPFLEPILGLLASKVSKKMLLRMDAAFPLDRAFGALHGKYPHLHMISRQRVNPVLENMAQPYLDEIRKIPFPKGDTFLVELRYRAKSWGREHRVVMVVQRRIDTLFHDVFFLVTTLPESLADAETVLNLYRGRGRFESHIGELEGDMQLRLSSTRRGAGQAGPGPMERNAAWLLIKSLAYQLVHILRSAVEERTGVRPRIRVFREQILKTACRGPDTHLDLIVEMPDRLHRVWDLILRILNAWRRHLPTFGYK